MRDYFSILPEELIDLIFIFCNRSPISPENNVFVRYEYIIDSTPHFTYNEYIGGLVNGLPSGYGKMVTGSRYIDIPQNLLYRSHSVATEWLYKPLLYILPRSYKLYYNNKLLQ